MRVFSMTRQSRLTAFHATVLACAVDYVKFSSVSHSISHC